MLDLDFSPEQQLLATTTRDVLARHCPLEVVRQMEDDPVGYPADLWRQLASSTWSACCCPSRTAARP